MPSVEQLPFGHKDLPVRLSENVCHWCQQRFSAHAYQWQLRNRLYCSKLCKEQKKIADKECASRLCGDCEKTKIFADFTSTRKSGRYSTRYVYCKVCEANNTKHSFYNGEVNIAKQLCKVCGDIIVKRRSNKALEHFVTCSAKCNNINRRRDKVECGLCQKMVDYKHFEKSKSGHLHTFCNSCRKKELIIEPGFLGFRPTYNVLLANIRAHAKAFNKSIDLSTRDAKKLWSGGCRVCGSKVGKFVHRNRTTPVNKDTVVPMCRACAVLDQAFPLGIQGLIKQAKLIAAFNPGKDP